MSKHTCLKTAVASLVLASSAVVWALAPKYQYGKSISANPDGPMAVTTTVPTLSEPHAAYVVAAVANASGNGVKVIAWQDTTTSLLLAGSATIKEATAPLMGVGIAGLDASRVVTADVDGGGVLTLTTWTIGGTAGVVKQNGYSTPAGTAYHAVSIVALSSTQVVTAIQGLQGSNLTVEAWTIAADGLPTGESVIATGPVVDAVSIAAVGPAQVVTAASDDSNSLWVNTWGVDSAGVSPQHKFEQPMAVSTLSQDLSIGAGSALRFVNNDGLPFLERIQSAFTPIVDTNANVQVLNWGISSTGTITAQKSPSGTTSRDYFNVAACMLPQNIPITLDADVNAKVNIEWFGSGSEYNYTAVTRNGNGVTSMSAAVAGDDYSVLRPYSQYNVYFVTAVLTSADNDSVGSLEIREFSYPEEPLFL